MEKVNTRGHISKIITATVVALDSLATVTYSDT